MQLVSLSINPIPSGGIVSDFEGYDGLKLRSALWEPTRGPARGTVCIVPGRGEFIEKYFETAADLRARGFAVATLDWRGQGLSDRPLSDPLKGHVRDFSEYDTDLQAFMQEVVLPDCPPPLFAIGHSMGGTILIRSAHQGRRWFDRFLKNQAEASVMAFNLLGTEHREHPFGQKVGRRVMGFFTYRF